MQSIGRITFVLGFVLLAFSIYYGSTSLSYENAITPDPLILKTSLITLSIWGLSILVGVIVSIGLTCDSCSSKLCNVPHGYKSTNKRNRLISFFYPDDIYEKKFICFNCNTEYDL